MAKTETNLVDYCFSLARDLISTSAAFESTSRAVGQAGVEAGKQVQQFKMDLKVLTVAMMCLLRREPNAELRITQDEMRLLLQDAERLDLINGIEPVTGDHCYRLRRRP